MSAEIRRLERAVTLAERKLAAAKNGEMWPLTGSEKRQVITALAGGSVKVVRGKSTARADSKLKRLEASVTGRLSAELSALQTAHQTAVNKAAADKAAKKRKGWF
ncbi:hypothetical protein [Streptomyces sp. V4I2]|uniref:hypothetical protein n=1 Tax=Streptomyces sp. V4I2 TaxID=3042280 RepID=UPI0027847CD8|nr:hypothetical protein [Streptomyces sp. V4I2]MDQ1041774.1 hypothetical protein [Streptomyces sp. V4I2]